MSTENALVRNARQGLAKRTLTSRSNAVPFRDMKCETEAFRVGDRDVCDLFFVVVSQQVFTVQLTRDSVSWKQLAVPLNLCLEIPPSPLATDT